MSVISVDYGRSTVKAVSGFDYQEKVIIPSVVSYDASVVDEKVDLTTVSNYNNNPLDYLKVRVGGEEIAVGEVAAGSEYGLDTSNYDDIDDEKTKQLILTSVALLLKGNNEKENIKLITTLPADQYKVKKKEFADKFSNKDFAVEVFDYESGKYIRKEFYIEKVMVKQQGFFSFMHSLLDEAGNFRDDKTHLLERTVGVIDIGKYSTDLFSCDSLDPVPLRNQAARVPGMARAFENIQSKLINEYSVRPKLHKVQKNIENNHQFTKNGDALDTNRIIESEYKQLVKTMSGHITNKIDMSLTEIDNWLVCGGGAKSDTLRNELSRSLKRELEVIDNPRWANALGGYKVGLRGF